MMLRWAPQGPARHLTWFDRTGITWSMVWSSGRSSFALSEYGSSTGYLLFTMYGGMGGNAIQARPGPASHSGDSFRFARGG
jgi:hypothetical protein